MWLAGRNWPVGVVEDVTIGVLGLEFDSRAGQIKRSFANGWPLLQRFCVVLALSAEDGPRPLLHASA